jgi:hypothetical protein
VRFADSRGIAQMLMAYNARHQDSFVQSIALAHKNFLPTERYSVYRCEEIADGNCNEGHGAALKTAKQRFGCRHSDLDLERRLFDDIDAEMNDREC